MAYAATKGWKFRQVSIVLCWFPLWLGTAAAHGSRSSGSTCRVWLAKTVARVEKLPEQKWRDAIIAALKEDSCTSIPAELRRAARNARTRNDTTSSDRMLAKAATAVLGPACPVPEPARDARALAASCPLPAQPEFQLSDAVLGDLRAVDYAVVNALAQSLLAVHEYDSSAQRLVMDFILSAGLRGEEASTPTRGKKAPR